MFVMIDGRLDFQDDSDEEVFHKTFLTLTMQHWLCTKIAINVVCEQGPAKGKQYMAVG